MALALAQWSETNLYNFATEDMRKELTDESKVTKLSVKAILGGIKSVNLPRRVGSLSELG